MRWFLRRLAFYVFATWVALTLTFLLPRLMPGSPIAGILQHLSPSQIQANPGIIQTYETLFGGGHQSIWQAYGQYLHRVATLNFGISTSNYPTKVSEVVGRTVPYSIVLVGIAFLLSFILGTTIGMIAAWRRGGGFDTVFVPIFMALGAFPAYFTALLLMYFLGPQLKEFLPPNSTGDDSWLGIANGVWRFIVRPIAVGGMLTGATYTLFRMRKSLGAGLARAFHSLEQDSPQPASAPVPTT